jgi:hypothetical protein
MPSRSSEHEHDGTHPGERVDRLVAVGDQTLDIVCRLGVQAHPGDDRVSDVSSDDRRGNGEQGEDREDRQRSERK